MTSFEYIDIENMGTQESETQPISTPLRLHVDRKEEFSRPKILRNILQKVPYKKKIK